MVAPPMVTARTTKHWRNHTRLQGSVLTNQYHRRPRLAPLDKQHRCQRMLQHDPRPAHPLLPRPHRAVHPLTRTCVQVFDGRMNLTATNSTRRINGPTKLATVAPSVVGATTSFNGINLTMFTFPMANSPLTHEKNRNPSETESSTHRDEFVPKIKPILNTVISKLESASQSAEVCGPRFGCSPRKNSTAIGPRVAKLILWKMWVTNPEPTTEPYIMEMLGRTTNIRVVRWICSRG
mmetsp:Transcript_17138/g.20986  ORF Transcript_17138/g.20986 Transcript_17138/m.20986 type:complete len:236 (-) Transcript_17138:661-1368(-)